MTKTLEPPIPLCNPLIILLPQWLIGEGVNVAPWCLNRQLVLSGNRHIEGVGCRHLMASTIDCELGMVVNR